MRLVDRAELTGARITNDGYLVAEVRCARTGTQDYLGAELGREDAGRVTVYRPETAVFSRDSLATFVGKPVTVDHPPEAVTADNWKKYAAGDIGEEIARDGEFVRVPIKLMDAAAIQAVRDGKREISMGYTSTLRWEDGVAPDGTPYQAVMGDLKMNHLALVDRGRAGPECRVGDSADQWGAAPITTSDNKEAQMPNDALKTVVLGDKAVQVAPADEATIEAFKASQTKALKDAQDAHDKAIADKDTELATKDAEIADLKKKVLSDEDLDKRVQDRATLVDNARKLAPKADFKGLSDADIRKAAVTAVRGEDAVKDKSEAYVSAAFDLAIEAADKAAKDGKDTFRAAAADGAKPTLPADHGQAAYEARMRDAYRSPNDWGQPQKEAH